MGAASDLRQRVAGEDELLRPLVDEVLPIIDRHLALMRQAAAPALAPAPTAPGIAAAAIPTGPGLPMVTGALTSHRPESSAAADVDRHQQAPAPSAGAADPGGVTPAPADSTRTVTALVAAVRPADAPPLPPLPPLPPSAPSLWSRLAPAMAENLLSTLGAFLLVAGAVFFVSTVWTVMGAQLRLLTVVGALVGLGGLLVLAGHLLNRGGGLPEIERSLRWAATFLAPVAAIPAGMLLRERPGLGALAALLTIGAGWPVARLAARSAAPGLAMTLPAALTALDLLALAAPAAALLPLGYALLMAATLVAGALWLARSPVARPAALGAGLGLLAFAGVVAAVHAAIAWAGTGVAWTRALALPGIAVAGMALAATVVARALARNPGLRAWTAPLRVIALALAVTAAVMSVGEPIPLADRRAFLVACLIGTLVAAEAALGLRRAGLLLPALLLSALAYLFAPAPFQDLAIALRGKVAAGLGYAPTAMPVSFYGVTFLPYLVLAGLAVHWLRRRDHAAHARVALGWLVALSGGLAVLAISACAGDLRAPLVVWSGQAVVLLALGTWLRLPALCTCGGLAGAAALVCAGAWQRWPEGQTIAALSVWCAALLAVQARRPASPEARAASLAGVAALVLAGVWQVVWLFPVGLSATIGLEAGWSAFGSAVLAALLGWAAQHWKRPELLVLVALAGARSALACADLFPLIDARPLLLALTALVLLGLHLIAARTWWHRRGGAVAATGDQVTADDQNPGLTGVHTHHRPRQATVAHSWLGAGLTLLTGLGAWHAMESSGSPLVAVGSGLGVVVLLASAWCLRLGWLAATAVPLLAVAGWALFELGLVRLSNDLGPLAGMAEAVLVVTALLGGAALVLPARQWPRWQRVLLAPAQVAALPVAGLALLALAGLSLISFLGLNRSNLAIAWISAALATAGLIAHRRPMATSGVILRLIGVLALPVAALAALAELTETSPHLPEAALPLAPAGVGLVLVIAGGFLTRLRVAPEGDGAWLTGVLDRRRDGALARVVGLCYASLVLITVMGLGVAQAFAADGYVTRWHATFYMVAAGVAAGTAWLACTARAAWPTLLAALAVPSAITLGAASIGLPPHWQPTAFAGSMAVVLAAGRRWPGRVHGDALLAVAGVVAILVVLPLVGVAGSVAFQGDLPGADWRWPLVGLATAFIALVVAATTGRGEGDAAVAVEQRALAVIGAMAVAAFPLPLINLAIHRDWPAWHRPDAEWAVLAVLAALTACCAARSSRRVGAAAAAPVDDERASGARSQGGIDGVSGIAVGYGLAVLALALTAGEVNDLSTPLTGSLVAVVALVALLRGGSAGHAQAFAFATLLALLLWAFFLVPKHGSPAAEILPLCAAIAAAWQLGLLALAARWNDDASARHLRFAGAGIAALALVALAANALVLSGPGPAANCGLAAFACLTIGAVCLRRAGRSHGAWLHGGVLAGVVLYVFLERRSGLLAPLDGWHAHTLALAGFGLALLPGATTPGSRARHGVIAALALCLPAVVVGLTGGDRAAVALLIASAVSGLAGRRLDVAALGWTALVLANLALFAWWRHTGIQDLAWYGIPGGLSLLVAGELARERLRPGTRVGLTVIGLAAVYGSLLVQILRLGAPAHALALFALALAGIGFGLWRRRSDILAVATAAVVVDVVAYLGVNGFQRDFTAALLLLGAGGTVTTVAALLTRRRKREREKPG